MGHAAWLMHVKRVMPARQCRRHISNTRRENLKKTQNSITEIGWVNFVDFLWNIEFLAVCLFLSTLSTLVNINSSFWGATSNLLNSNFIFLLIRPFSTVQILFWIWVQWWTVQSTSSLLIIIKNWVQAFLKDFQIQMNNL